MPFFKNLLNLLKQNVGNSQVILLPRICFQSKPQWMVEELVRTILYLENIGPSIWDCILGGLLIVIQKRLCVCKGHQSGGAATTIGTAPAAATTIATVGVPLIVVTPPTLTPCKITKFDWHW